MAARFSARRLIDRFGGVAALRDTAERHGVFLTYYAIRKWAERDAISSDGLAALVLLADMSNIDLQLREAVTVAPAESW